MMKKCIFVIACAGLATQVACADVTVFDNSNATFDMGYTNGLFPSSPAWGLSINLPADQQTPDASDFYYEYYTSGSSPETFTLVLYALNGNQVAMGDTVNAVEPTNQSNVLLHPPLVLDTHNLVGPGLSFDSSSQVYVSYSVSELVPTERFSVGVQFHMNDELHYGFIEFVEDPRYSFDAWQPVRWGYETTPDTPLVIPAAGSCGPMDLSEPYGSLDFFDVSAFLNSFIANEPTSDLNFDGTWDFFDVSAFLNGFNAGCP